MQPMLAMGDMATPVLFLSLLVSDGILLVAICLLALSLWKRFRVAVVIASIFVLIAGFIGITFMPMARDAFSYPLTEGNYKSVGLIFWCRVVSVIWMLAITAAVFCFFRVIQKRGPKKGAKNS